MEGSKRQRQVSEMMKRHFSEVLRSEGLNIYGAEPLVTVTEVAVSPDMSVAKIYLSIWNTENKQAVLLQMEEEHQRLKQAMAQRVKRHMRRLPEMAFFQDDTLDEIFRVESLFDRLYEEGQMPEATKKEEEEE